MPVPQNTVIAFKVSLSPIQVIGIPALLSEDAGYKL
jgi:hypothetical protein